MNDSDSLDRLMIKVNTIAPGVALEELDPDTLNTPLPSAAARLDVLKC